MHSKALKPSHNQCVVDLAGRKGSLKLAAIAHGALNFPFFKEFADEEGATSCVNT